MKKESAVIIGFGWVGQANALALSILGYDTYYFDPASPSHHYSKYSETYSKLKRLNGPLEADSKDTVYIVCVGDRVNDDGEQDISLIEKALRSLKDADGTIVLRSTVRPDYLKNLDFDIYLPEFLHEKTGVEECIDPHFFVVGKKDSAIPSPSFFEVWAKRSMKSIECTPEEASHIKYLSNIWNSLRIAFVNEFGRSIHAHSSRDGSHSEMENLTKAKRVLYFLFGDKPYFQYGRAFTGHCLPKDMRAYIAYGSEHIDPQLLKGVLASNAEQEEFQKIHHELEEWYSPWRRVDMSGHEALKALGRAIVRNFPWRTKS